jgi:pyrroline-5-carboxylate reductase
LKNRANEIQLVLQHPDEIKQIMTELRANTDIKKLLVSRLAALESAALESAATNAHH